MKTYSINCPATNLIAMYFWVMRHFKLSIHYEAVPWDVSSWVLLNIQPRVFQISSGGCVENSFVIWIKVYTVSN